MTDPHPADPRSIADAYPGEVVLILGAAARDAALDALCAKYRERGLVVLDGGDDASGDDAGAVRLIGRDGQQAADFPADTAADDDRLVTAIERELFASE